MIECDACGTWYHATPFCTKLTEVGVKQLLAQGEDENYICWQCINTQSFGTHFEIAYASQRLGLGIRPPIICRVAH